MSKELEALEAIRKELQSRLDFPINLTPEYQLIKQALTELEELKSTLRWFRNRWCKVKTPQELNEVCSYFINEVWKDHLKVGKKEEMK